MKGKKIVCLVLALIFALSTSCFFTFAEEDAVSLEEYFTMVINDVYPDIADLVLNYIDFGQLEAEVIQISVFFKLRLLMFHLSLAKVKILFLKIDIFLFAIYMILLFLIYRGRQLLIPNRVFIVTLLFLNSPLVLFLFTLIMNFL